MDHELFRTETGDDVTLVNLIPEKGGRIFYELATRLPEYSFLGVKGGYAKGRQVLRELPNVTLIENIQQMREDVYSRTKVVLMPSAYESFGMVASEAMASGIPVIAHPTPGLLENLDYAGIYCDRDDLEGWESTIRTLMEDRKCYAAAARLSRQRSGDIDGQREMKAFVASMELVTTSN